MNTASKHIKEDFIISTFTELGVNNPESQDFFRRVLRSFVLRAHHIQMTSNRQNDMVCILIGSLYRHEKADIDTESRDVRKALVEK